MRSASAQSWRRRNTISRGLRLLSITGGFASAMAASPRRTHYSTCMNHSVSPFYSHLPPRTVRVGDGPSHEHWDLATSADRTNEGGREFAQNATGQYIKLGWVRISHSSRVRASLLWMYASGNSSVWYDAGLAFVVQDAVDLYDFLGVPFTPPGTAQKASVLRNAAVRLRRSGVDTIVFMRHVDGCNAALLPILRHGCWAQGKRVVELVSLHPFSAACPVSPRFMRGQLIHTRMHELRASGGGGSGGGGGDPSPGGSGGGGGGAGSRTSTRIAAQLCSCTCTEKTRSPFDIGSGWPGDIIC